LLSKKMSQRGLGEECDPITIKLTMQLNHGSYIAVVVAEVRRGGVVNLTIQYVTTHNPLPLGFPRADGLRR